MDGRMRSYVTADTYGKSQIDLVIKVYDGVLGAFAAAREAYQRTDNDTGYQQIQRAKRFLTHLYTTLDFTRGGEVAANLGKLYAFVLSQTQVIEATKDMRKIDDNMSILRDLRAGWAFLKEGARREAAAGKPATGRPGGFSTSA